MAAAIKTPGVYIKELNAFPNTVVEVATAVPAFIGYTEKVPPGTNVPTRLSSLTEYHNLFGGAYKAQFTFTDASTPPKIDPDTQFLLYPSMRLFFDNGGGPCWIVSVGTYDDVVENDKKKDDFLGALPQLEKVLEPTMLVAPDAVLLEEADWQAICQQFLQHCGKMQSRISILDVYHGERLRTNKEDDVINRFRDRITSDFLNYGQAYYPWVNTSIVDDTDVDYSLLTEDSLATLQGSLNSAIANVAEPTKTAIAGLIAQVPVAKKKQKLLDAAAKLDEPRRSILVKAIGDWNKEASTDTRNAMNDAVNQFANPDDIKQKIAAFVAAPTDAAKKKDLMGQVGLLSASKKAEITSLINDVVNAEGGKDDAAKTNTKKALTDAGNATDLAPERKDLGDLIGEVDTARQGLLAPLTDSAKTVPDAQRAGFTSAIDTWKTTLVDKTKNDADKFKPDAVLTAIDAVPDGDKGENKELKAKLKGLANQTKTALISGPNLTQIHRSLRSVSPIYLNAMSDIRKKLNLLPPSGGMAGVYTRVDNAIGVFKAPANTGMASVISPAVDLTNEEQEDLNMPLDGKAINAIRSFPGRGVLIWGARTLDGNSQDWRYINVRRTIIMLEQSIKYATLAYVFEPNTASTWVTVRNMISNFLTNQWKAGALAGAKPEDAFSVDVGLGSTMTANDILDGFMNVTVKVALVRPAEFIVITFQQKMQTS